MSAEFLSLISGAIKNVGRLIEDHESSSLIRYVNLIEKSVLILFNIISSLKIFKNSFFEITFVEDDSPFYQLSNLPVYRMQCALFEYSDEDFDTGIETIDQKTGASAYQVTLDLAITGGNHYEIGEQVTQTVGVTAAGLDITVSGEVQNRTKTSDTVSQIGVSNIEVTNSDGVAREFIESNANPLNGSINNYAAYVTKLYGLTDTTETFDTDGGSQNVEFENFADGFIDFSETNPFGDPSETY